jgi:hypothetical protein
MRRTYARVTSVRPLAGKRLLVGFENGVSKVYDCTPLLAQEPFAALSNESLFRSLQADPHGYGIVWSEELDLAESELWLHGEVGEPEARVDRQ